MNSNVPSPLPETLKQAFPAQDLPKGLHRRVMALRPTPPPPERKQLAYLLALTAALMACAFLLISSPEPAVANDILRQVDSIQGRFTEYAIVGGKKIRAADGWLDQGSQVENRYIEYFRDGGYRKFQSKFLVNEKLGVQIAYFMQSGMMNIQTKNVRAMVEQVPHTLTVAAIKKAVDTNRFKVVGSISSDQFEGKNAEAVTLSSDHGRELRLFANPKTHRIIGWTTSFTDSLGHSSHHLLELTPQIPPPGVFDPIFDINGVKTNVPADLARWQAKFAKPLATFPIDSQRKIDVRNVMRNPAGDVFILFTSFPGKWDNQSVATRLSDPEGGIYRRGSGFSPSSGPDRTYFNYDGRPLEGSWFIRVSGPYSGPVTVGFKTMEGKITPYPIAFKTMPEDTSFNTPSYMPYMSMPLSDTENWKKTRLMDLASFYKDKGDYKREERNVRDSIAISNRPGSLRGPQAFDFQVLSRSLENQGRRAEALAAMKQAKAHTEPVEYPFVGQKIESEIKRLSTPPPPKPENTKRTLR